MRVAFVDGAGVVVNVAIYPDDTVILPAGGVGLSSDSPVGPGWLLDPPTPPAEVSIPSSLEFLSRFTMAELAAVHSASLTNPLLAIFLTRATAAQTIDPDHPDTVAGLSLLVGLGLLTEARRDAVLAG